MTAIEWHQSCAKALYLGAQGYAAATNYQTAAYCAGRALQLSPFDPLAFQAHSSHGNVTTPIRLVSAANRTESANNTKRMSTVCLGSTHFQMKTLKNVGAEMALHVLAYNIKRAMQILGSGGLIAVMRA